MGRAGSQAARRGAAGTSGRGDWFRRPLLGPGLPWGSAVAASILPWGVSGVRCSGCRWTGWGRLPPGRQPHGASAATVPTVRGSEDRAADCFCSSPFPLPEGSLLAFPSPAPTCFFLAAKRQNSAVSGRPTSGPGPRCARGRRRRKAPAWGSRRRYGVLCFDLKAFPRGEASVCVCVRACVYLIREEVTGFSVFKRSGLLAINLPLRLSLQTLSKSDTGGKPPAGFLQAPAAVLPGPQGLHAVPGRRGVPRGLRPALIREERPRRGARAGPRGRAAATQYLASKVSFTFMKLSLRAK